QYAVALGVSRVLRTARHTQRDQQRARSTGLAHVRRVVRRPAVRAGAAADPADGIFVPHPATRRADEPRAHRAAGRRPAGGQCRRQHGRDRAHRVAAAGPGRHRGHDEAARCSGRLVRPPRGPPRGARLLPPAPAALLLTAAVFVPLLIVMPPSNTLWAHLHGTVVEAMEYAEDGSGLSVVNTDGKNAILYANGIGQGALPYGDVHTALGALPAFIHPAPRTAAVIGLGSGDTVHAVAGRREIERVTCVEIIRGELATLNGLRLRLPYGGLVNLLDDPRIEQVFGDGRIHLRRGGTYDIIEADALRPGSAYSGTLYSDAYFALLRDHLAPNGLAATWAPTQRVYNTFIRAFPHVVSMPGI